MGVMLGENSIWPSSRIVKRPNLNHNDFFTVSPITPPGFGPPVVACEGGPRPGGTLGENQEGKLAATKQEMNAKTDVVRCAENLKDDESSGGPPPGLPKV